MHDSVESFLEKISVQRTADLRGRGNVELRIQRLQLLDEPQTLLRVGQRKGLPAPAYHRYAGQFPILLLLQAFCDFAALFGRKLAPEACCFRHGFSPLFAERVA